MIFSIIVPIYNVDEYIEHCINSILSQENVELEIILVDDGSTDDSGKICDQFADRYEHIQVIHQHNKGLSEARNTGIKHAKGDYILFVDGDDCIVKDSIKYIEREIINDKYPDIVFLECKKVTFGRENSIKKIIPMMDGVTEKVRDLERENLLMYISQLPKYPAAAWSKAIKRKLFLDDELLFEAGLISEDLEWAVRLFLKVESAGYCCKDYYLYRQRRKNSLSSIYSEKKALDMLYTVEKWSRELKDLYSEEEQRLIKSLMEYVFRFLILNLNAVSNGCRAEYINRTKTCACVLGQRKDVASKLIRNVYKICGINITSRILRLYLSLREIRLRYITYK